MIADVDKSGRELRLVFAGGGTGGHLYPALALAQAFARRTRNLATVFVGTAEGLEARVVPAHGHRLVLLPVRGLLRRLAWQNFTVPWRLAQSVWRCLRLLREFEPHLVIGTGGYVSGPALLAAWLSGRTFVIQEQNSYPGLVNRWLGGRADAVFLSFAESRRFFSRHARTHVVGNPVRAQLQPRTSERRQAAAAKWQLRADTLTLLVFGGSQGARRLNELMLALLPELLQKERVQVLWGTGPAHIDRIAAQVRGHERVVAVPFIDDMDLAYALADLAICRAGASTIFELAQSGLPALLIPFPFATGDHQTANALALAAAGAARVLAESELTAETLLAEVRQLVAEAGLRQRMAQAARQFARPNAADDIVATCLALIHYDQ